MPRLADLRRRFHTDATHSVSDENGDDVLVVDARARLTTAQCIEKKLLAAMQFQSASPLRGEAVRAFQTER